MDAEFEKTVPKGGDGTLLFSMNIDKETWLIILKANGEIMFNREKYPESNPDDFARAFIEILERGNYLKLMIEQAEHRGRCATWKAIARLAYRELNDEDLLFGPPSGPPTGAFQNAGVSKGADDETNKT